MKTKKPTNERQDLVQSLAGYTSEELAALVNEVKDFKLARKKESVPSGLVIELKKLLAMSRAGTTVVLDINLPLTLTVNVKADFGYEYGHIDDYRIELKDTDPVSKSFYKRYVEDGIRDYVASDSTSLETLDSDIASAVSTETHNQERLDKAFRDFEHKYGIEPWSIVEDKHGTKS